jgi:hypothetical protein
VANFRFCHFFDDVIKAVPPVAYPAELLPKVCGVFIGALGVATHRNNLLHVAKPYPPSATINRRFP